MTCMAFCLFSDSKDFITLHCIADTIILYAHENGPLFGDWATGLKKEKKQC